MHPSAGQRGCRRGEVVIESLVTMLAAVGGLLLGSGLVGPFEWIVSMGVASDLHWVVGGLLMAVALGLHVLMGGPVLPWGRRR